MGFTRLINAQVHVHLEIRNTSCCNWTAEIYNNEIRFVRMKCIVVENVSVVKGD